MADAWLVIAAGEDRQHGGNDGYEDDPSSIYRWDSTVPNHSSIAEGDAIVIWDKRELIGASMIERIDEDDDVKNVYRCPHCEMGHIKRRKTLRPEWRCFNCSQNFDHPIAERKPVHTYASRHDVAWVDLAGVLEGRALRRLCDKPRSQLSLRQLDWSGFRAAIERVLDGEPLAVVDFRGERIRGGHRKATVRVRLGQAEFRRRLLHEQGALCAITGEAPPAVLEAGHLYSYASVGKHHDHGGLLLRRDIHRLFDSGQIAVDPRTMRIDVDPSLDEYRQYSDLHGRALACTIKEKQQRWLHAHWEQHREFVAQTGRAA
jgi:hypothetical protein